MPESELQDMLRLMENVVLHTNDAVMVTQELAGGDQQIAFVNPAFTLQTGYSADEVVGRHPRLLIGPRTELSAQLKLRDAVAERRPVTVELLHYRKDGTSFWVENSVSPLDLEGPPFTVSVQRDITDRKTAEQALQHSEQRLETLLGHTADIITVIEADGTVRYSNPAAGRLTGLTEDFNGTSSLELIHPDDRDTVVRALIRQAEVGQSDPTDLDRVEFRLRYADGTWHHVEALVNNCLDHPAVRGLVVTVHDVTERKVFEAELRRQALHDHLTGLPNRSLLLDRLSHALGRGRRKGTTVAVLFLDLDRFKVLNDSMGHHVGDRLLGAVAARLEEVVRPGDTVARFGGDEFVVLCEDVTGEVEALTVAQRLLDTLQSPFVLDGAEIFVSASIGITLPVGDDTLPESLIRDADAAMYRAKERGRARVELFDQAMRLRAMERLQIESDLRRALERGELELHYQPMVALADRSVVGVEALLRWNHPTRGMVGPDDFIPLAEETGIILPIGAWVLEEACRWRIGAPLPDEARVWVNMSARQLAQPDLVSQAAELLRRTGAPASQIGLEITETVLMEDPMACIAILGELRGLGFSLALDDFGTGYSSLGYLTRFPIDTVKVDRSFVAQLVEDRGTRAIVTAVIGLTHTLGMDVVAEGVETDAQLSSLRGLGCDVGQGYLFAKPSSADELGPLDSR
ncbi:MAG TPA: EAL domain-containing protein [Acidimicrobiales bacterium]|nr:EAL domain-containing protein [Acidimicrobiales bacterium]